MVLAHELVDAAYKAGFDRILLAEVRNKFFYKKDYLLKNYRQYLERRAGKEGKTVDKLIKEMQKRMEAIYDRTATELGMRKVKGYWILEHTIRKGNKFLKRTKYIGKKLLPKKRLEQLKKEFLKELKGERYKYISTVDAEKIEKKKGEGLFILLFFFG